VSPLRETLADYLALRRSLGHKLDDAERQLSRFVAHLEALGAETVTLEAAIGFICHPDLDPATTNPSRRLTAVRGFARHLAGADPRTEIPPAGLVVFRRRRRRPYLFSDAEVAALMRAGAATSTAPLRSATIETLIGLLAVTGLRVGEALRLDRGDVDLDDAVITVRATKFGKSRQVPLAASTAEALAAYAAVRDRLQPAPQASTFFVSLAGTPLAYSHFCATFTKALRATGIGTGSPVRPRIHDLRHSFAVRTLVGWHRDGLDVAALLPRLSTYLGHREPRYTYTYLTATPELLGHAAARLQAHQAARP